MKGRKIIKRVVVSLSEAAEVGHIENIVFDREARMAALLIKRRGEAHREIAATGIANVRALGRDAVTVAESDQVEGNEKVEELRSWPNLRQLVGCRVITEGGTYLGTVRDVVLDPDERRITDFELVARGVIGRLRGDTIPATGHLRFGTSLVIVPNAVTLKGKTTLAAIREVPGPIVAMGGLDQPVDVAGTATVTLLRAEVNATEAPAQQEDEGLTRAIGA